MGRRRTSSDLAPEMIESIMLKLPVKWLHRLKSVFKSLTKQIKDSRRTSSCLPPEMIESILLKLPVKSLLRFKSVCKSWNMIISDPLFVKNHQYQNCNPQSLFLRQMVNCARDGLCLVKLEDGKLQTVIQLKFSGYDGNCLCYCGEYGVLLITNDRYCERSLLWNPSTRTTQELSCPYGTPHRSGLCYDPSIDDFKVVFVYEDFYAVYSCKKKSWSKKKLPYPIADFQSTVVSVNGAIYWLSRTNNCGKIIYYDPRDDDKLKIMQKPKDVPGDLSHSYLLDLGGHLCMCGYQKKRDTIRIWRKEKAIDNDSWKELITIHDVDMPIRTLKPVCFLGNKILTKHRDHHYYEKLFIYNPLDKTFQELKEKLNGRGSLVPYRETLYTHTLAKTTNRTNLGSFRVSHPQNDQSLCLSFGVSSVFDDCVIYV